MNYISIFGLLALVAGFRLRRGGRALFLGAGAVLAGDQHGRSVGSIVRHGSAARAGAVGDRGLVAGDARDIGCALRTAHAVQAGWVQVNQGAGQVLGQSYGGVKQSGVGKDCSRYSIEEYLTLKRVPVLL